MDKLNDEIKDQRAAKRANFKVAVELLTWLKHKASIAYDKVRQLDQQDSEVKPDQARLKPVFTPQSLPDSLNLSGDGICVQALQKARERAEITQNGS